MRLTATTTLFGLFALALAQGDSIRYDEAHNATVIYGTWSSGAGLVQTGPNFVNPKNKTFNPPKVGGISYSFSEDGFFEQAEYRYGSNPARPACPNVTMLFQHGTYELLNNGSIVLNPFEPDGLVQTQTPCGGKTSTIQQFSAQILFQSWRIFYDPPSGGYHLHLFRFDGAPLNKMILRYEQPVMHPTTTLVGGPTPPPRLRRRSSDATNSAPSGPGGVALVPAAVALGLGAAVVALL